MERLSETVEEIAAYALIAAYLPLAVWLLAKHRGWVAQTRAEGRLTPYRA